MVGSQAWGGRARVRLDHLLREGHHGRRLEGRALGGQVLLCEGRGPGVGGAGGAGLLTWGQQLPGVRGQGQEVKVLRVPAVGSRWSQWDVCGLYDR